MTERVAQDRIDGAKPEPWWRACRRAGPGCVVALSLIYHHHETETIDLGDW